MPEKDPLNYTLITYAWVLGMAQLGGVAAYIRKLKTGHSERFKIAELLGEMLISAFVGLVTFFLCESAGLPQLVTISLVGITGNMGSKAILIFEEFAAKKIKNFIEK